MKKGVFWHYLLLGIAGVFLSACVSRIEHADSLAKPAGLQRTQVQTKTFLLTVYSKQSDSAQPFNIYIDGDGMAWRSLSEPSMNPTPRKALGLVLAAKDPAANVVYIARPCQYTPLALDPYCNVTYWTDRRFSEEVIASVNDAISQLTSSVQNPKLNLIGYSGGGAVAVLVAARRNDVVSIRTIAGNLDHAEVNRLHNVTPMKGSLNAIDQARKVGTIPQIHYSGASDAIVSPSIAKRFHAASESARCVVIQTISGVSHETGWDELWPDLLKNKPVCKD